ncbi:MAG: TonB-dependent receptor [Cyclobacteriaceae bacterium]|nr:TonB-dependent receptor [Cyclobacteriaceae bacterium]
MRPIVLNIYFLMQSLYAFSGGVLQGTISTESDEALIGAHLYIREIAKGAVADSYGQFQFQNIQSGNYTVEISFIGFETQRLNVEVKEGQTVLLNAKLKEGAFQLSDLAISASQDRPVNTLSQADIKLRTITTSQDILRIVPGLFIGQHAGGGKAEQIFLRGFDIDHGTDINIEVDGMPVNMVSHAHGQGYADLHFLMPELISIVDFDKGPYFADKGDLNTAGYVSFQTKAKLDYNFVKVEGGNFGFGRLAAGANVLQTSKSNAYIASEYFRTDSYFQNSQKFHRFNLQARFNTQLNATAKLQLGFSAFDSKWDASGQIPDRSVADASISQFGSIDNTEGGNTGRINLFAKTIHNFKGGSTLENQLYVNKYDFSLFSNFTFYLNDSVNGDQIHQREGRWIYGYKNSFITSGQLFGKDLKTEIGGGLRYDVINDIALSHTVKRVFLDDVKHGDIRQTNFNAYWSETLAISHKLSVNAALRFDYLNFSYFDKLNTTQAHAVGKSIINPKMNLSYQLNRKINLFARAGTGFHSNDARVVVGQSGKEILPKAYGIDLGADMKLFPNLFVHLALWQLDLDQEFVYVGDEGVIEPSGKTTRQGVDLSVRYQFNSWLFADMDLNFTKPRSKEALAGANYIPLAPLATSVGGLSFQRKDGFNGSLRYRYMGDRPAIEDNSIVAKGYFIADAVLNYTKPGYSIGLSVENIFDQQWKETQFNTESRLFNEAQPVSEIHFTSGTPLAVKVRVMVMF